MNSLGSTRHKGERPLVTVFRLQATEREMGKIVWPRLDSK